MAAEKLTRGRFAQIIIMLTLLIVAFTWRTIDHDPTIEIVCTEQSKCTFFVNNSLFEAQLKEQKLILHTSDIGWEVTDLRNIQLVDQQSSKWIFNIGQESAEISFKVHKLNETIATKINISGR